MGYAKDTVHGITWITLLRGVTRVVTFIRLGILGRLLTPAQFGYFGIATLILSLLEILTETGINIFLIQEKGHIKEYIHSAWVVSIIRGIVLSSIILFFSPIIVTFFNAPGAFSTVSLMAAVPFIRGFINPAIITYQKELYFRQEFQLRSLLFIVDVMVSITLGFIFKNAIAFVWGAISSAIVEVVLSYLLFSARPKFIFELDKITYVIRRGWWVTIMGIFSYFAENGDNFTVGKLLGPSYLGVYQIAYKFSTLPVSEITNVVGLVVFPVFSKFSEDINRVKVAFLKVSVLTAVGAAILGGIIFIFAQTIILIFMGEQWVSAVPVIRILAVYGVLRTFFGNFGPLFLSLGKQQYVAQMTFIRLAGLGISIVPLVTHFGMVGAAYAMLISIIVEIPVILFFSYKIFTSPTA